jgi:hypothetical protein
LIPLPAQFPAPPEAVEGVLTRLRRDQSYPQGQRRMTLDARVLARMFSMNERRDV